MKDYHDYSCKLDYTFTMPDHLKSEPLRKIENEIPRAFWSSPESLSTLCEVALQKSLSVQRKELWSIVLQFLPKHQQTYLKRDLYLKEASPVGIGHFEKLSNKLQRPQFPYIRFVRTRPWTSSHPRKKSSSYRSIKRFI